MMTTLLHYVHGRKRDSGYETWRKDAAFPDWNEPENEWRTYRYGNGLLDIYQGSVADEFVGSVFLQQKCKIATEDQFDETGKKIEVQVRPYDFVQCVRADEQDQSERMKLALELAVEPTVLMDRHRYQQAANGTKEEQDELIVSQIDRAKLSRNYERVKRENQEQIQQYANDENVKQFFDQNGLEACYAVGPAFSTEHMGMFLAALWHTASDRIKHKHTKPLLLLCTSPARIQGIGTKDGETEKPDGYSMLLEDSIIFLHDAVLPKMPKALCGMVNISFNARENDFEDNVAARSNNTNKVMTDCLCAYPTNNIYDEYAVFCPFEDGIFGYEFDEMEQEVAKCIVGQMPKAYNALTAYPQAAGDYDILALMIELEKRNKGVRSAQEMLEDSQKLNELEARLTVGYENDDGYGLTHEQAKAVMATLEMGYITSCRKTESLKPQENTELISQWIVALEAAKGLPQAEKGYTNLLVASWQDGGATVLIAVSEKNNALFDICAQQIIDEGRAHLAVDALSEDIEKLMMRYQQLLKENAPLAAKYERYILAGLKGRCSSAATCILMTDKRKNKLMDGHISAQVLTDELLEDCEALKVLPSSEAKHMKAALELYAKRKDDPQLTSPLTQKLSKDLRGNMEGHADLIRPYVDSGLSNSMIDRNIVDTICCGKGFEWLQGTSEDESCLRMLADFFSDAQRRKQYEKQIDRYLMGLDVNEVNLPLFLQRILVFPTANKTRMELYARAMRIYPLEQALPQKISEQITAVGLNGVSEYSEKLGKVLAERGEGLCKERIPNPSEVERLKNFASAVGLNWSKCADQMKKACSRIVEKSTTLLPETVDQWIAVENALGADVNKDSVLIRRWIRNVANNELLEENASDDRFFDACEKLKQQYAISDADYVWETLMTALDRLEQTDSRRIAERMKTILNLSASDPLVQKIGLLRRYFLGQCFDDLHEEANGVADLNDLIALCRQENVHHFNKLYTVCIAGGTLDKQECADVAEKLESVLNQKVAFVQVPHDQESMENVLRFINQSAAYGYESETENGIVQKTLRGLVVPLIKGKVFALYVEARDSAETAEAKWNVMNQWLEISRKMQTERDPRWDSVRKAIDLCKCYEKIASERKCEWKALAKMDEPKGDEARIAMDYGHSVLKNADLNAVLCSYPVLKFYARGDQSYMPDWDSYLREAFPKNGGKREWLNGDLFAVGNNTYVVLCALMRAFPEETSLGKDFRAFLNGKTAIKKARVAVRKLRFYEILKNELDNPLLSWLARDEK